MSLTSLLYWEHSSHLPRYTLTPHSSPLIPHMFYPIMHFAPHLSSSLHIPHSSLSPLTLHPLFLTPHPSPLTPYICYLHCSPPCTSCTCIPPITPHPSQPNTNVEEEMEEVRLEELALQRRVKLMGRGGVGVGRLGTGEEGGRTLEQVQHRKAELGKCV